MERLDLDKLELKINENIELSYGANMDEIASKLQKFTEKYLYIDDSLTLKFVDKITELPYENCRLIGNKKHSFLLYEEKTDRVVQVFDKYLSMYLTGEIDFEEDFDSISTGYESTESTESTGNETESTEETESEEFEEFEEINENAVNREKFADMIKKILLPSYTSHFRIYFRSVYDNDFINAVFVNQQLFRKIETDNEIDLEKTFNLSFTTYLKTKGYGDVTLKIGFFNELFAEIVIVSEKKLSEETISEIEENAMLNINTNDIIFFIHRDDILKEISEISKEEEQDPKEEEQDIPKEEEKEYIPKETREEKQEEQETQEKEGFGDFYEDSVYAREVPLARLPTDLADLVLRKTHQALFYNETVSFYYQNHEFVLKNEGLGFYSLFDKDLIFYISHLHPDFYPNAYEYSDLPIAQFYY